MPSWDVAFDLRIDRTRTELIEAVARADALAQVIRGLPIPPQIREQLDRLNIRRAVRGTTGIEGAEVTDDEVHRILGAPAGSHVLPPSRHREEQEVRNAERVMTYIAATLRSAPDTPVTEGLIAQIHTLTTQEIAYSHNTPGEYRSHAVDAGAYKPPRTRDEISKLMREFVDWLNSARTMSLPPAVRAIAAHFYFVNIHPFGDGNGRTARAIESYLLYQARLNALGFYSLSNFYYLNRERYIELLNYTRFSSGGDLTPFLMFSLQGLVLELETVHREVLDAMAVIAFRDYAHHELMRAGKLGTKSGERMYQLLLGIGEPVPVADIRSGAHPLGRLYRKLNPITLSRDINFLKERRLVVADRRSIRANLELMRNFTS